MTVTVAPRSCRPALTRILLFADLLLAALVFGLSFAHVMELPGKLQLTGPVWLAVQQHLYNSFGPFASVAEPLAILLAWVLTVRLWRQGAAGWLALLAALCSAAALLLWFAVVSPMNTRLNGWTAATLPPDWTACRNQWEMGHVGHAVLFGIAFCALAAAMLILPPKPEP